MPESVMIALIANIPWIVMAMLLWRMISAFDRVATLLARAPVPPPQPRPIQQPQPQPPVRPPVTIPAPAPKPPVATGPFADAPAWFQWGLHEIGFHETGNNLGIGRYIGLAHTGAEGDPWCAIFANAAFESVGITGTRSASSQSFRNDPAFVQLPGPSLGAVVVFWRGSQSSGLGHVGFYRGEDANSIWTLGGNENDMVQIEALPKSSASFGLVGYYWPKTVPLPTTGPVIMPSGSPIHVQTAPASVPTVEIDTPGKQTNIIATYFGGQKSAYGGPIIDTSPGVALPYRFTGTKPRVRVTGKTSGQSVDCDIVDIGPWNINDPYWKTGARPQAESGTDLMTPPRKTNRAGIDLTLAAAQAIGVDGKGMVDWEFITIPSASPSVM